MRSTSQGSTEPIADDDFAACRPNPLARSAGGLLMLAGVFAIVLAVQTWSMVVIRGLMALCPYAIGGCGLTMMVVALPTSRLRAWSAWVGVISSGALTLLAGVWMVFSFANLLVSLVALGLPPLGLAACVVTGFAIGPANRAGAARQRMLDQGLGMGT